MLHRLPVFATLVLVSMLTTPSDGIAAVSCINEETQVPDPGCLFVLTNIGEAMSEAGVEFSQQGTSSDFRGWKFITVEQEWPADGDIFALFTRMQNVLLGTAPANPFEFDKKCAAFVNDLGVMSIKVISSPPESRNQVAEVSLRCNLQ